MARRSVQISSRRHTPLCRSHRRTECAIIDSDPPHKQARAAQRTPASKDERAEGAPASNRRLTLVWSELKEQEILSLARCACKFGVVRRRQQDD